MRALSIVAPPLIGIDRLRSAEGTGLVVMGTFLSNFNIEQIIENRHREVGQEDLVDLIEDLLASGGVRSSDLLREKLIKLRISVEIDIAAVGRDLRTGKVHGAIGIVGIGAGVLSHIVLTGHATLQERTKEGA